MILSIMVLIPTILIGIFSEHKFLIKLSPIIGVFVLVVSCSIYSALFPSQIITTETKIYTLKLVESSEDNFYLGFDFVDGGLHYYYYTQDEKGLYILNRVNANNCKLKFSDEETPKIITKEKAPEKRISWLFSIGNLLHWGKAYEHELVLPTNTIIINPLRV